MQRNITIRLDDHDLDALRQQATAQRRPPREHAAWLVEQAIRAADPREPDAAPFETAVTR